MGHMHADVVEWIGCKAMHLVTELDNYMVVGQMGLLISGTA